MPIQLDTGHEEGRHGVYRETDSGTSIIDAINGQASWNANYGFQGSADLSFNPERLGNWIQGNGAYSDEQVALNRFEERYGDMKPTDKAFQKAAMGLPLSEEDQRLIQEEKVRREVEAQAKKRHEGAKQNLAMEVVDGASEELRRKILQSLLPEGMGDKFAGGVAERLDEELNSLIQDYETIKEFADFLANSTPEQRQALLNKYGDAAKKLFTDSEYRGQVGDAIVEAFKEGITDDIEKFTRIKSGDEKDIGYTTTHAALMAYGMWKRYGKKIGKDVVRAVDDDVAKNTVDSKNLKKAKDGNSVDYSPTKKHQLGGWGTKMDLDDKTAAQVLNKSFISGKQRYGYHDGKVYEFQFDNIGGWHGYPVSGNKPPVTVLRQMRDSQMISNSEYRRLLKGK